MKVYTTILGVTGVSVQPGASDKAGRATRDLVVASPRGELILRLVGETRDDLQVTFAAPEPGGWKGAIKRQLDV
jgi:hypothetical protein